MKTTTFAGWGLLGVPFLLAGCAFLGPDFETPSVTVLAVRTVDVNEAVPRFAIDLSVMNPNDIELKLRGISYALSLNDLDVVRGVANDLPAVPAYGEATFTLTAAVSLVDSMRFIAGLLRQPSDDLRWRLGGRLDVGTLMPPIRVEDSGTLRLTRTPTR